MLIDGLKLNDGSKIQNAKVESGISFPVSPTKGLIFYLENNISASQEKGLYVYDGVKWVSGDVTSVIAGNGLTGGGTGGDITLSVDTTVIATKADLNTSISSATAGLQSNIDAEAASRGAGDSGLQTSIDTHASDTTLHLTSAQNTLLDGIAPTVSSTEINYLDGVTSAIQGQVDGVTSSQNAHLSDLSLHLTASQNTLLDGIAPTVTSAEINYLDGVTSSIQGQIGTLTAADSTHSADLSLHLTASQNTLLDGIAPTVTSTEINYLDGVTSGIQGQIDANVLADSTHSADLSLHLTASQNTLLDGIAPTVSSTEINYLDGVTSGIQGQIDSKINKSGDSMTGALTLSSDPTQASHAATKSYVDAIASTLDLKDSVVVATTGNITLTGTQTIDGIVLSAGMRVLVKNQTTLSENGIYDVSATAWTRSTDADNTPLNEVTTGMYTFIDQGVVNASSGWVLTTVGVIALGTTSLTFTQFSGAGQITAGTGMTKTGNTLDVVSANVGRIIVNADNIDLASSGVTPGTYKSVGVDTYGRVTAGSNPTSLSGYGITDAAPLSHVGSVGTSHGVVTASIPGFMSGIDKTKLDSINPQQILDNSLPVMTKAEFFALAENRIRDNAGSGQVNRTDKVGTVSGIYNGGTGTITANVGIGANRVWLTDQDDNIPTKFDINGVTTYLGTSVSPDIGIIFPAAPDGLDKSDGTGRFTDLASAIAAGTTALNSSVITRQDLVLLESWHEKISSKDVVYPLGNTQYGASSWSSITLSNTVVAQGYSAFGEWDTATKGYGVVWSALSDLDKTKFLQDRKNNIYSDNGELIQVRYRIRVIKGLGDSWMNVYPSVGTSVLAYTQVSQQVKARGYLTTVIDLDTQSSATPLPAYVGDTYAARPTHTKGLFSIDSVGALVSYDHQCFAVPIALVQRRNQGAYHPVYNPSGCSYSHDPISTNLQTWSKSSITNLSLAMTLENSTTSSVIGYLVNTGNIGSIDSSGYTRRPDGKFYDAIYAEDIQDLRNSARRKTPQELLSYSQKAIAGKVRGFEGVPFTRVGVWQAEALGFTGGYTFVNDVTGGINLPVVGNRNGPVSATGTYLTGNSGTIYEVGYTGGNELYLLSKYGNVSTDFTLNSNYTIVYVTPQTAKSESPTWTDIIGSPANIAATFPNGVEGQWIPVIPDGTAKTYPFNRKVITEYNSEITLDNGITWGNGPWINYVSFAITTNDFTTNNQSTSSVSLWHYNTKANFLETANNAAVIALGDIIVNQVYESTHGAILQDSLIGEVNINAGYSANNSPSFVTVSMRGKLFDNVIKVEHTTPVIAGTNGSISKALPYITSENSQFYLQFVYKEMKYTTTWGDNNKFDIVSGESTVTDNNGQLVQVGQKRIKLPFFTGGA